MVSIAEYRQMVAKQKKPSKYRNKPCVVNGIRFQSQKEGQHYAKLLLLEKHGHISQLKLQVPFVVSGKKRYIADFTYFDANGDFHVVDVKGVETAIFKLKRALMWEKHGIIVELI